MQRTIVPDIVHNQTLTILSPELTVRQAVRQMAERHIGAVMITEGGHRDGRLTGIFTERDLLNRVVAVGRDPDAVRLSEVMTRGPDTVAPGDSAIDTLLRMQTRGYRHLPVVDDGRIIGMVSIRDLFDAVKHQLEEDIQEREAFIFGATAA